MTHDRALDMRAELADLKRRIRAMESLLQLGEARPIAVSDLQDAYVGAPALLASPTFGPKVAHLWCMLVRRLTAQQLLELGRMLREPFPWVPFLRVIRRARAEHPSNDTIAADEHLTEVVRDLLDAQGLSVLDPEDLFGTPHALERAMEVAVSGRSR